MHLRFVTRDGQSILQYGVSNVAEILWYDVPHVGIDPNYTKAENKEKG